MAESELRKIEARCTINVAGVAASFFWCAGTRIPYEWTEFEVSDDKLAELEIEAAKGQIQLREPLPPPVVLAVVKPAPSRAAKRKAQG